MTYRGAKMIIRNCSKLLFNIHQLEERMEEIKQKSEGIDWDRLEEDFMQWLANDEDKQ